MRSRALAALCGAVLVATLGACGDQEGRGAPGAPTTAVPPALDGRTFLAREVIDDGEPRLLVEGTEIRLSFADGTIGASAGCNSFGGDYRLDAGVLRVGSLGGTEIGCDPARHAQDDWLVGFLTDAPTVALVGDELTLATAGTTMVLLDREVAEPDRPLEGTVWVLETVVDGDKASTVPTDEPLTLVVADGRLRADTGCNTLAAAVEVRDGNLLLGEVETTTAGCRNTTRASLEDHVVAVLSGSLDMRIEADTLRLSNGSRGLDYVAAPR